MQQLQAFNDELQASNTVTNKLALATAQQLKELLKREHTSTAVKSEEHTEKTITPEPKNWVIETTAHNKHAVQEANAQVHQQLDNDASTHSYEDAHVRARKPFATFFSSTIDSAVAHMSPVFGDVGQCSYDMQIVNALSEDECQA